MIKETPDTPPVLQFYAPHNDKEAIGLLSIPHSGEWIPEDFRPYLTGDEDAYKEDVDYKVNELVDIEALNKIGVGVMVANVHRVACDLNRSQEKAILHWVNNTKGVPMVKKAPDDETLNLLQTKYYRPYVDLLKDVYAELKMLFGEKKVSFIDLHSMPSKPTPHHLKQNPGQNPTRPDFCLSDLKGKSCDPEYIKSLQKDFMKKDYQAKINEPYFGGYITQYAHTFATNAVQIETNRMIYMDEKTKTLIPEKASLVKENLTAILIEHFQRNRY